MTEKGNINISKHATFTQISNYMSLKCSISDTTGPHDTEANKIPDIADGELQVISQPTNLPHPDHLTRLLVTYQCNLSKFRSLLWSLSTRLYCSFGGLLVRILQYPIYLTTRSLQVYATKKLAISAQRFIQKHCETTEHT
jgi:hypothetical protein